MEKYLKGRKKERPSGQTYAPNLSDLAKNGLLPTPTAQDFKRRGPNSRQQGLSNTENWENLLPTPTTGSNRNSRNAVRLIGAAHQHHGVALGLMQVVEISARILPKEFDHWEQVPDHYRNLLPTPTAVSDAKGGCTRTDPKRQNDTLAYAIHGMVGTHGGTSQLNPRFVMEMMGFPPD